MNYKKRKKNINYNLQKYKNTNGPTSEIASYLIKAHLEQVPILSEGKLDRYLLSLSLK